MVVPLLLGLFSSGLGRINCVTKRFAIIQFKWTWSALTLSLIFLLVRKACALAQMQAPPPPPSPSLNVCSDKEIIMKYRLQNLMIARAYCEAFAHCEHCCQINFKYNQPSFLLKATKPSSNNAKAKRTKSRKRTNKKTTCYRSRATNFPFSICFASF